MISFEDLKSQLKRVFFLTKEETYQLYDDFVSFKGTPEQHYWLAHCGYCEGLHMRYTAFKGIEERENKGN